MSRRKRKTKKKIESVIRKSPINYFSDLFIISMVVIWIVSVFIMSIMAVYATLIMYDTSIWSYLSSLVGVPLSCGGAIWMIKNSVQHAIANSKGKVARMDFPAVNAEGENDGNEVEMFQDLEGEKG